MTYILYAGNKNWNGNSPLFWAKNESGYTSNLEDCQYYDTYEQAAESASRNWEKKVVPINIEELSSFKKTQVPNCDIVLEKARKAWNEYLNR